MAGIKLVGGAFNGECVLWDGRAHIVIQRMVHVGTLDPSTGPVENGPSDPMKATASHQREAYRVRVLHVEGEVFHYAAPEHWSDRQAISHLLMASL